MLLKRFQFGGNENLFYAKRFIFMSPEAPGQYTYETTDEPAQENEPIAEENSDAAVIRVHEITEDHQNKIAAISVSHEVRIQYTGYFNKFVADKCNHDGIEQLSTDVNSRVDGLYLDFTPMTTEEQPAAVLPETSTVTDTGATLEAGPVNAPSPQPQVDMRGDTAVVIMANKDGNEMRYEVTSPLGRGLLNLVKGNEMLTAWIVKLFGKEMAQETVTQPTPSIVQSNPERAPRRGANRTILDYFNSNDRNDWVNFDVLQGAPELATALTGETLTALGFSGDTRNLVFRRVQENGQQILVCGNLSNDNFFRCNTGAGQDPFDRIGEGNSATQQDRDLYRYLRESYDRLNIHAVHARNVLERAQTAAQFWDAFKEMLEHDVANVGSSFQRPSNEVFERARAIGIDLGGFTYAVGERDGIKTMYRMDPESLRTYRISNIENSQFSDRMTQQDYRIIGPMLLDEVIGNDAALYDSTKERLTQMPTPEFARYTPTPENSLPNPPFVGPKNQFELLERRFFRQNPSVQSNEQTQDTPYFKAWMSSQPEFQIQALMINRAFASLSAEQINNLFEYAIRGMTRETNSPMDTLYRQMYREAQLGFIHPVINQQLRDMFPESSPFVLVNFIDGQTEQRFYTLPATRDGAWIIHQGNMDILQVQTNAMSESEQLLRRGIQNEIQEIYHEYERENTDFENEHGITKGGRIATRIQQARTRIQREISDETLRSVAVESLDHIYEYANRAFDLSGDGRLRLPNPPAIPSTHPILEYAERLAPANPSVYRMVLPEGTTLEQRDDGNITLRFADGRALLGNFVHSENSDIPLGFMMARSLNIVRFDHLLDFANRRNPNAVLERYIYPEGVTLEQRDDGNITIRFRREINHEDVTGQIVGRVIFAENGNHIFRAAENGDTLGLLFGPRQENGNYEIPVTSLLQQLSLLNPENYRNGVSDVLWENNNSFNTMEQVILPEHRAKIRSYVMQGGEASGRNIESATGKMLFDELTNSQVGQLNTLRENEFIQTYHMAAGARFLALHSAERSYLFYAPDVQFELTDNNHLVLNYRTSDETFTTVEGTLVEESDTLKITIGETTEDLTNVLQRIPAETPSP